MGFIVVNYWKMWKEGLYMLELLGFEYDAQEKTFHFSFLNFEIIFYTDKNVGCRWCKEEDFIKNYYFFDDISEGD